MTRSARARAIVLGVLSLTAFCAFPAACSSPSEAPGASGGIVDSESGGRTNSSSGGDAACGGRVGPSSGGRATSGGSGDSSEGGANDVGDLGAFPVPPSPITRGGTMTFTNVGAPGAWPRRLDREPGDPACDYKDGDDTWGGHCCQTLHATESEKLAPFDEEMTLILKAIHIKQLAIYQPPKEGGAWDRVTTWDERGTSENIWLTQNGEGSSTFVGDLTKNDCVSYVMQEPLLDCGDGSNYYCPNDPGILHHGYSGSKLVAFLGSMDLNDAEVRACDGDEAGHAGPWVAFVASELVRDGGRKWNGLCNCYSQTGTVGDGCGEMNVFEVVLDNNEFSNREFASTGVRSYQAGHVGGAVCKADCERDAFEPLDVDVVDACAKKAYDAGPEIVVDGSTDGCPVWRRPKGDRFFFVLLDEPTRTIQVAIIHPEKLPPEALALLPNFPKNLARADIDALIELRLPK